MFILRKHTELEGVEMNFWLGDGYNIVYKIFNPIEFDRLERSDLTVDKEKCFAVITCNDGKTFIPLFGNQRNKILTSNGVEFEILD